MRIVIAPVLIGLWLSALKADDAPVMGIGGTIRPMQEHPTIEMVAEYVHAWLARDQIKVECVFLLRNDGPATTVQIGFPNNGGGEVGDYLPFREFHSYVNGQPVDVAIMPDTSDSTSVFLTWWVKEVYFGPGELKSIRDEYTAAPGMGIFGYSLSTGSAWAGSIGVGDIIVTLIDIPDSSLALVHPMPTSRGAGELRWHFEKLEPTRESEYASIGVAWRE